MNNDIQELKNELRTAWKSYKQLLGGANEHINAESFALSNFLISGHYLPYETAFCNGVEDINCITTLSKCIQGHENGQNTYEDCKRLINSSTFLKKLHDQLLNIEMKKHEGNDYVNGAELAGLESNKIETNYKDNTKFDYSKGKEYDNDTRSKMILNLLGSIGFVKENFIVKHNINGLTRDNATDTIVIDGTKFHCANNAHDVVDVDGKFNETDDNYKENIKHLEKYIEFVYKNYKNSVQHSLGDTNNGEKFVKANMEKGQMTAVVKSLIRAYIVIVNEETLEGKYDAVLIESRFGQKDNNKFKPRLNVSIMSNPMVNDNVVRFTQHYAGNLISTVNSLDVLLGSLFGVQSGGYNNSLSRNNIYSSINFNQSGGRGMPSHVEYARNILTRYLDSGLITDNVETLIEYAADANSKYNKAFNTDDITNIKKGLMKWRTYEYEILKIVSYMNTLMKRNVNNNEHTGGALVSNISNLMENLLNKGKSSYEKNKGYFTSIKELIEQIKRSVDTLATNPEHRLITRLETMGVNMVKAKEIGNGVDKPETLHYVINGLNATGQPKLISVINNGDFDADNFVAVINGLNATGQPKLISVINNGDFDANNFVAVINHATFDADVLVEKLNANAGNADDPANIVDAINTAGGVANAIAAIGVLSIA